jgi:hypothetical protein
VSPTAPTFVTLNDRLNKAHRRIRELQARETELLAQNRTLCAVINELTDEDPPRRHPRPARAGPASKRVGRRMFDLNPIGAMFLIAVLGLIAAVAYGRDDR